MRLAIVGSRSLGGSEEAEQLVGGIIDHYEPDIVVSGGAKGVDRMAARQAKARGIRVVEYLPKVQRWRGGMRGRIGYKERNMLIALDCDRLVRVADEGAQSYGSGWTREYAESTGKPTEEHVVSAPW